jgi:formylglycine-generating enzyme
MKKMRASLFGLFVLTLLLSACNLPFGSSAVPTVEVPLATLELPPTPTIEPVVPEAPTIGSTISWFDTSTLVYVPGGEFVMGADEPKEEDFNPAHPVSLNGFWIYSTKVTNEMYNLCVSLGQCTPVVMALEKPYSTYAFSVFLIGSSDLNDPVSKDLPVTNVTWNQADTYCKWAGGRLPTEAEWEKTARGTKVQAYPWGDEPASCNFLNFKECSGFLSSVLDHPEGISDYKALDMAGNAYEWVNDWFSKDYYTHSPIDNPTGPDTGTLRSIRGSSFDTGPKSVFSARRSSLKPDQSKIDVGFRCVVDNPAVFAPICQVPAVIGTNLANAPLTPGESTGTETSTAPLNCTPPEIKDLNYQSWCVGENRSALDVRAEQLPLLQGGIDWGFGGTTDWSVNCYDNDCPPPIAIPKSGGLHIYGKPGHNVTFTLRTRCTNPDPPQAIVSLASCPNGYNMDSNGVCLFNGTVSQPATTNCPSGFVYNKSTNCCSLPPGLTNSSASQTPVCGPGYIYDPINKACILGQDSNAKKVVTLSKTTDLFLAACPVPKDTNKPSQPQPTPSCTDPAGCP